MWMWGDLLVRMLAGKPQNELIFSVLQDWPKWALWGWSAGVIFPENESIRQSLGSILFQILYLSVVLQDPILSLSLGLCLSLSLTLSIQNLGFLLCGTLTSVPSLKRASLAAQLLRICLPLQEMQETQVRSLGGEDPLQKETWRRKCQPTPVFLPGKSHGQRSLVGYSPWACKESDRTEDLLIEIEILVEG